MKKKFILAWIFILCGMIVLAQNKEEKKLIIETVGQLDQKFVTFYKNSQADSLASLFSPNCHVAREYSTIVEGRENVLAMYNKDFKSGVKISSCKFEVLEQKVYDDIVLEIGTNIIEYTKGPDKILFREAYNYMFVWKKSKEGKYQIRSAMWNSMKNPCK